MNPQQRYLEAKVRTAKPEELMLMLFDGAIRFARLAKPKIEAKDYAASCDLLIRAQRILVELIGALTPEDLGADVYGQLARHYWFAHDRLVRANLSHDLNWIDEALFVLSQVRDNWASAIRAGEEKAIVSVLEAHPVKSPAEAGVVTSVNLQG